MQRRLQEVSSSQTGHPELHPAAGWDNARNSQWAGVGGSIRQFHYLLSPQEKKVRINMAFMKVCLVECLTCVLQAWGKKGQSRGNQDLPDMD